MNKTVDENRSGLSIPKINTPLLVFLVPLLLIVMGLFYNLRVIVEHKTTSDVVDLFNYLCVFLLSVLWGSVFLGWVKYIGLKKRAHVFIGLLCITLVALNSLGLLLLLRESGVVPKSVPAFLSLSLKASFLYVVILIFWRGFKDKFSNSVLIRDKRYSYVLILGFLFYGLYLLTGPGNIVSSPRFAISDAQKYLAEVKETSNYPAKSFQRDIDFYEQLYALGKPKAAIYLGIFNEAAGNFKAAENWYSKASNLANRDAGKLEEEKVSLTDDTHADLQTYRSHALQGNATATFLYATLIDMQGDPAREDVILWYEKAAELGRNEAAEHLADYYWAGKYVPKNRDKACFWGQKIPKGTLRGWRYKFLCRF